MFKISWEDERKFTGLEIEGGYVKLAQAQNFKGSRKLVRLIVKKLASRSEKALASALSSITDELKGHIEHLSICIPRHKVTVRFLRFPTVNEKEIAGMVRLQSAKELPFSKEEIVSDYLITERTKDGYAKVALVIAHLDIIKGYLGILKKANLEPERLTLSTEAVGTWYREVLGRRPKGPSLLIDIDNDNTDIVIFSNSHLSFTRGLNLGSAQLQERADLRNKLAEEIRRTMEGYGGQEGAKKIERILLGGAGEAVEGLKPFLEQELNLPCQSVAALKNLSCQKRISSSQYKPEASLLRVLGMALDAGGRKLNLLPESLREKHEIKWKKKRVYKTFALLVGIMLLGLLVFAKKIHDRQLHIFYLDREIGQTAPFATGVESILEKIELIESRRKIEGSAVDTLRLLHSLIPRNISLSNFSFAEYGKENKIVILQGLSTSMSEIFKFINTLEKSAYFKNVQLIYVSEKKAKISGVTDFKIECTLEE